jgi:hypothetical protein
MGKVRDVARWGVKKHPVGKRAYKIYRKRKDQYDRYRKRKGRRSDRSR